MLIIVSVDLLMERHALKEPGEACPRGGLGAGLYPAFIGMFFLSQGDPPCFKPWSHIKGAGRTNSMSLGFSPLSVPRITFFGLFRAAPTAYGSSQPRGQIRAAAAGLCHSHSHARFKPNLQLTPQLTAMLDL